MTGALVQYRNIQNLRTLRTPTSNQKSLGRQFGPFQTVVLFMRQSPQKTRHCRYHQGTNTEALSARYIEVRFRTVSEVTSALQSVSRPTFYQKKTADNIAASRVPQTQWSKTLLATCTSHFCTSLYNSQAAIG